MNCKIFTECDNIKEKILSCKKLDRYLSQITQSAEEYLEKPIEALDFSTLKIYSETGSRREFEKKYFERRARLNCFSMLLYLYDDEKYKSALEDIVWAICDEYTWALPAHFSLDISPDSAAKHIDLFAAETGFGLCEVLRLTGEKINPVVKRRAEAEVRRRIIDPVFESTFRWEKDRHNWAAVCAGSVGACFMYLADDAEFKKALPRLLNSMDNYLTSLGDDGTCYEGYEYFKYGFGYFTYFAELLRQYTGGEINLFEKHPKIAKAAKYAQAVNLGYGNMVNFADSLSGAWHLPGLSSFLSASFEEVIMPEEEYFLSFGQDGEYRYAHFVRDFVWTAFYEGKTKNGTGKDRCTFFEESGMYVKITPDYEFASVAGKNNVPHNHNDVGTFILRCHGEAVIEDLGKGLYCADYFNDKRYTFLATSSAGHSVPIIDGNMQSFGGEYLGRVAEATPGKFSMEMQEAYALENLTLLKRSFELESEKVTLTDDFEFKSPVASLRERLTTLSKPEISGDEIFAGGKKLIYNKDEWELEVSSEEYDTSRGKKLAYLIDFILKNPSDKVSFKLEIDVKK